MNYAKNLKFIFKVNNHVILILRVWKDFAFLNAPEDGKKKEFGAKNKKWRNFKDFITMNSSLSKSSEKVIKNMK